MREEKQGAGPLIGSIIIVILLLAAGYYLLKTTPSPAPLSAPLSSSITVVEPVITAPAKPPRESTEIKDIEADAKSLDTASLDSGLENLDLLVK